MPNTEGQAIASLVPPPTDAGSVRPEPSIADGSLRKDGESLLAQLSQHRTLGAAPVEELAWLIAHGELRHYEAGEITSTPDTPVPGMFVLLSGRLSIHLVRNGTRHKIAEWNAGRSPACFRTRGCSRRPAIPVWDSR